MNLLIGFLGLGSSLVWIVGSGFDPESIKISVAVLGVLGVILATSFRTGTFYANMNTSVIHMKGEITEVKDEIKEIKKILNNLQCQRRDTCDRDL